LVCIYTARKNSFVRTIISFLSNSHFDRGSGVNGSIGHGSIVDVLVPQQVEKLKSYRVVDIDCFYHHAVALVDHSSLPVDEVFMARAFGTAVNDDAFSDVTFLVDNQEIYAHRFMLAHRCKYFRTMFGSGMRESTQQVIHIPNVSKDSFLLLLHYLYTDKVKMGIDHALELYNLADLYGLRKLQDLCCASVRQNLTIEKAGPLLQKAAEHPCEPLKTICMKFVVANFPEVSKTDGMKQVSHGLLLEIVAGRKFT
jgi:hypothetical protein